MRIAVIGMGKRLGNVLTHLLAVVPSAKVVAVTDLTHERTPMFEAKPGDIKRFSDPEQMISSETIDMLMIGSPNFEHLRHAEVALRSDVKHIFIEKPVVTTIDDSFEFGRLCAKHGGVDRLIVGMVLRYSRMYKALTKAKQAGVFGEMMSIEASEHIAPYHGSFFMRDWRRSTKATGGFMLEKCCHDLDLYQGLCESRPKSVCSFGGRKKYIPKNRPTDNPDYLDVMTSRWGGIDDSYSDEADIIDYQTAIISYESGATLAFHTNLNVPDEHRRFCVIGTDGMAEGDFLRNYLNLTDAHTGKHTLEDNNVGTGGQKGHYGADREMCIDIADYIAGKTESLPLSIKDALEAGLTALAIDIARTENRLVDCAPFFAELDRSFEGV